MAARQRDSLSEQDQTPGGTLPWLYAFAALDLIVTLGSVSLLVAQRIGRPDPLDARFVVVIAGLAIAGVAVGGVLIGLAAMVRVGRFRSTQPLSRAGEYRTYYTDGGGHSSVDGVQEWSSPGGTGISREYATQVLAMLAEMRDLMRPAPGERDEALDRTRANLQRIVAQEIIGAINARRLGKARELHRNAEAAYGKTATLERLAGKISEATIRNEPLDYAFTRRVVEESIAEGRWDTAEQSVQALFYDHPTSARCRRLWDETRRARLYRHIQARTVDHRWAEAVAAAEEFLERFPNTLEAETLRAQMATLRANAEILKRKQYESKFKEFVSTHHYPEALRIAKHVVSQFPDSPQAHALRDQIPLLEKRIAG